MISFDDILVRLFTKLDFLVNNPTLMLEISVIVVVAFLIGAITIWSYNKVRTVRQWEDRRMLRTKLNLSKKEYQKIKAEKEGIAKKNLKLEEEIKSLEKKYASRSIDSEEFKKLKSEHDKLGKDIELLSVQNRELKEEKDDLRGVKEREYQKIRTEKERVAEKNIKLEEEIKLLEKERASRSVDIKEFERLKTERERIAEENIKLVERTSRSIDREEFEKLKSEHNRLGRDIELLNVQNQRLKEENDNLREMNRQAGDNREKQKLISDLTVAKQEHEGLKAKNVKLSRDIEFLIKQSQRLKEYSKRLKEGDEKLRYQLKEQRQRSEEEKEMIRQREQEKVKREKQEFPEANKKDIKQIRGIGKFIEKKLHLVGVYTIEQIANFTKEDIERVTELIKYFPGRIERDNWIFQAKEILRVSDKNQQIVREI